MREAVSLAKQARHGVIGYIYTHSRFVRYQVPALVFSDSHSSNTLFPKLVSSYLLPFHHQTTQDQTSDPTPTMSGRLASKVAIITGSSSGIGRAIALAFASEGASLLLSDLTPNFRLEYPTDSLPGTTLEEALALGARAAYHPCDTTKSVDVQALVAKAVETYGRLDIMVNNAGIAVESGEHGSKPVWEVEEGAFEKTLGVNTKGVFLGTKFAAKQMVSQEPGANGDRGWIVNMASVYGLGGGAGISKCMTYLFQESKGEEKDGKVRD
jgi:NADP-dependent 3-hydroxy acid dehydrogenase YdfG